MTSTNNNPGSTSLKITCGIDWSEKHHDIALVDGTGALVAKRRITESVEGFNELLTMLAEAGDIAEDPIPIAIEMPRGLLVASLRATGRKIYPINPVAVARYSPSERSPTTPMPWCWPTFCAPTRTSIGCCPTTPS